MSNKALIVLLLLTAATLADDKRTNAISTLTSPSAELHRRLAAVDELTEMQATAELLRAWADGGEAVRIAVPVGFHAIGVRALGPGLTALGDEDERVRAAGAALLGALGRAGRLGVNRLLIALNDESALVRRQAALALGNIGAAAENAVSGLIALAIDRPAEASIAMQAMTRITLDVQLNVARKPLPERIRDSIRPAESWLLRMQKPDGSWGDLRTTALVLIALC
ncbi:MAG: HEAT repeat domain-containing protein, partial [Planctomycetota bacterium]